MPELGRKLRVGGAIGIEQLHPFLAGRGAAFSDSAGKMLIDGDRGLVIGMKTFGASAPLKELQRKYGFEPESLVAAARKMLGKSGAEGEG